jgi:hypothetical protein
MKMVSSKLCFSLVIIYTLIIILKSLLQNQKLWLSRESTSSSKIVLNNAILAQVKILIISAMMLHIILTGMSTEK